MRRLLLTDDRTADALKLAAGDTSVTEVEYAENIVKWLGSNWTRLDKDNLADSLR